MKIETIFVTGGAGYIGSHLVKKLIKLKYKVLVYDNLSKGHKESIDKKASFIKGDLSDKNKLDSVFKKYKIDSVMHFAGSIEAAESIIKPEKYFTDNVVNGINLLNAMVKHNVKKMIYSSSAGVYGNAKRIPIKEDSETKPVNVYGETKLMFENILRLYDKIHNVKFMALRYFNSAGSDERLGEDHNPETHLIPLILKAALNNSGVKVFGTDYPTKDGTCIRDYIHVIDLANAHILALNNLDSESKIYNLGSENGYSVKEIIKISKEITRKKIKVVESGRRKGDPAILIASSEKIKKELGWKSRYDLRAIIKSAWNWHKKHPEGYKSLNQKWEMF